MSCIVNRNKEGKIVSVNAKNGQSSELFKVMHGNIFMADADTSVKALSKVYTPQIEKMFEGAKRHVYDTGEPMVFYSNSRGGEYTSLEEVLLDENIGEITMGFKNPNTDTFIPVLKFNATGSERAEFLTSMVQQGFLSAERELGADGVTRFVGKGSFSQERLMGAKGARFEALMNGNGRTKLNSDGTLEIDFMDGYTTMIVDGQQKVIRIDNVRQELEENPTAENKVELLALKAFRDIKLFPNQKKQTDPKEVKRIERAVWNFLERMGFSVTTLENYRKNYNTKYGKDPDINAIADLANKVVAIAEGRDMSGEFIEEVAHIAIEAYAEQNSIVSALANVHLTPEYNQHQAFYREKYAPFYKGVALEEQVRREVMGKILAQEIASQFENIGRSEERDNLLGKIANIWDKFVGYIRSRFGAYEVAAIRDLNRRIAESILKEDQMSFQEAFESDNFYYNAQPAESKRIESHLREVKAVFEDLFYNQLKETIPNKATLDRVRDDMETVEVMSSVNAITGVAEKLLTTVGLNVKDLNEKIARTGVKESVSVNDFISFSVVKDNVLPSLESMRDSLEKLELEPELESTRNQIVERIKSVRDNVGSLSPKIEKDASDMIEQLYKGILDQSELTDDEKQRLMQHLDAGLKDVSFMANLFGIATNSSNPIVTLVAHLSQQMNINTAEIVNNEVNPLLRRLTEKNLERFQKRIIQRDADGKATYYYISPIRYDLFDKDLENFKVKTLAEISGKKVEEVKELREKRVHERTIAGSPENYTKFTDALRDYNRDSTESMFNENYYADRDKVFSEIDASDYTKAWLRNFSTVRAEMRSSYPAEAFIGNRLDKTKLTSAQREKEYDSAKMRRKAAEAYNEFGDIKDGLQVVSTKGLTAQQKAELKDKYKLPYDIEEEFGGDITVIADGRTLENLTDESRLALDLFNYNMYLRAKRADGKGKRGPSEAAMTKLEDFTDPIQAYEWALTMVA